MWTFPHFALDREGDFVTFSVAAEHTWHPMRAGAVAVLDEEFRPASVFHGSCTRKDAAGSAVRPFSISADGSVTLDHGGVAPPPTGAVFIASVSYRAARRDGVGHGG